MTEPEQTRQRRRKQTTESDRLLPLRNILNIIFMLGAIVGMCVYFFSDHTTGIMIILTSMAFKITECSLRLIR